MIIRIFAATELVCIPLELQASHFFYLKKNLWFFSNFSTKPQFLYEGAIFLKKFNIKN